LYDSRNEHDACGVGFVVDIKGRRSHEIVRMALRVLINLEHRGASGSEPNSGDGAGILVQTPDVFLRKSVPFTLPPPGAYGAGLVFLPHNAGDRDAIKDLVARIVEEEGQSLLGWRDVPVDDSLLGDGAKATQPIFQHLLIGGRGAAGSGTPGGTAVFECKLYVIRKRIEAAVDALKIDAFSRRLFYIASLSAKTLLYKGMLTARQLEPMFTDLSDEAFESSLALVHQRFSTNTFPS